MSVTFFKLKKKEVLRERLRKTMVITLRTCAFLPDATRQRETETGM